MKGAGAHMSGILSSCCPFLTNAAREGRGSPPYTAEDMRLRLHNWTNSLSGSTQIPRQVTLSTDDKPGLPQLSPESSAITFVRSETSFEPGGGEGECKVILPAREGCSEMDQAVAATVAADFHPIPDGDWESEKGLEEEEVTLLQRTQTGDDELSITCLERKAAKTVLPVKLQVATFELYSALSKGNATSNYSSLPRIQEQPPEPASEPCAEPITASPALQEHTSKEAQESVSSEVLQDAATSQETQEASSFHENQEAATSLEAHEVTTSHETTTFTAADSVTNTTSAPAPWLTDQHGDSSTPSSEPVEPPPSNLHLTPQLPVEDATQASPSSELLNAISNLSAARGAGKSCRSRMTSTRAPTPWSAAEPEDDEEETPGRVAEEEQLERVDSSDSGSPFASVADTTESSYHTLPSASSSVERADGAKEPPTAHVEVDGKTAAAAGQAGGNETVETARMAIDGEEETTEEMTPETAAEVMEAVETETTDETITAAVTETVVQPVNVTVTVTEPEVEPMTEPITEPVTEPTTESAPQPAAEPATEPAATIPVQQNQDDTAAGDQPPATTVSDDVSLRYFCGAFRPVDHHMSRFAGLEVPHTAPERPPVPSGRSDSAVLPAGGGAHGGRGAASDSTLGHRSSSPGPPAADDSGVRLEAKRSSTDIPV